MKKLFLLFAASALVISAVAQKPAVNPTPKKANQLVRKSPAIEPASSTNLPKPLANNSKAVSTVLVGHSANAYSSLVSQSNQVSYEPVTGLIGYIHRGGPVNGTSGQIFNSFSNDNGATWDSLNLVHNNSGFPGRYPSGGFWNPAGNTDPNNVYSIAVGPCLPGGAGWGGSFVAWKKMNGTAKNFVENHGNTNRIDRNHFQILPSGKLFFTGYDHLDNDVDFTQLKYILTSAKLDATTDTLTEYNTTIIAPPFYKIGTDSVGFGTYSAAIAFNKEGTVGYYAFIGIRGDIADPTTNLSFRPIVYKTTDEGATWNIQPDFDFGTIPSINEIIPGLGADTTKIVPYFDFIMDAVVDANDNLHLVSYITGQSTVHPDSLGYTWGWSSIEGIMYDTYMTGGGNWDATIIDVQNTTDHAAADANDLDIDGRLQMGISTDRKKIFYTWVDSDVNQTAENVLPDLYVAGRHIDSLYVAEKMNVTMGTTLEFGATNHGMAPQVKENINDFTIYTVVTQFGAQPANDPVSYYFMKDVIYSIVPVSVNDIDRNIANISSLYPNPTNGLTNVDLSLVKNANVSIEVVNMMGQVVSSQDCGYKTTGMHKLSINASDLTSGIYFVTVKAGNSTSTSKMIVR